MRVLRSNKDSVMAMLEAFVHDPLINWRLLNTTTDTAVDSSTPTNESGKLSQYAAAVLLGTAGHPTVVLGENQLANLIGSVAVCKHNA